MNHLRFETRVSAELAIFNYINVWYNPNRMNLKQEITVKLKLNLARLSVVKNLNYWLG
ncbi:MAG: IS3 family transposase [Sphingobacteriaceae bacterium]|nr:IS3 family transposase [Sphingobacteriaceae bacterium]